MALQPRPPELASQREAGEVAGYGARPDDRDQRDHVDLALAGDDAAEQDRRLPRRHQPDEGAGLQEREPTDEQVGELAEVRADRQQDVLEAGRVDDA